MRVTDILRHKGGTVTTVAPSATVEDAARILGDRRIGALVVSEDGETVAGILSERDVVAHLAAVGRDGLDSMVSAVMTRQVTTCSPQDSIEQLMRQMTAGRFRHLPVVVDGRLAGIVAFLLIERRLRELVPRRRPGARMARDPTTTATQR